MGSNASSGHARRLSECSIPDEFDVSTITRDGWKEAPTTRGSRQDRSSSSCSEADDEIDVPDISDDEWKEPATTTTRGSRQYRPTSGVDINYGATKSAWGEPNRPKHSATEAPSLDYSFSEKHQSQARPKTVQAKVPRSLSTPVSVVAKLANSLSSTSPAVPRVSRWDHGDASSTQRASEDAEDAVQYNNAPDTKQNRRLRNLQQRIPSIRAVQLRSSYCQMDCTPENEAR